MASQLMLHDSFHTSIWTIISWLKFPSLNASVKILSWTLFCIWVVDSIFVFAALREIVRKNMPCQLLQERVRSEILNITRLLQQLVTACQGHMAIQPVYQSAECYHKYTQFYPTLEFSIVVSSCCYFCLLVVLCLYINLCMQLTI